jgi:hypothetical protein
MRIALVVFAVAAPVLAGCGGPSGTDGRTGTDGPTPDAGPGGFTPDPLTMGQDLPPVIPVVKIDVGGAPIELDVVIPGTVEAAVPGAAAGTARR